jgi:hypothetical protein
MDQLQEFTQEEEVDQVMVQQEQVDLVEEEMEVIVLQLEQLELLTQVEEVVVPVEQVEQAVRELLLFQNQHFKAHQESGQLMTHIITRKLDNGFQFQCQ